jgi:glycogen synthase
MRVLHLAYEDPRQPGSGGGSVRTAEINRRLARHHEIVAVAANYPGAQPRVEDGVRWVHVGPQTGGKLDRMTYFALLGPAIRRYEHDLVVEDFGAPFSVGFAPLWTPKPVVAMVQWLFASEMRKKYYLPFDWVERGGLRFYHDFIAVSDWLGATLRDRRPDARVTVVHNGVEAAAFDVPLQTPEHLLFVGRLDVEQKGCDLLLDAVALARTELGAAMPPVLIAGDGPDRTALEKEAAHLDLQDTVRFLGRVDGTRKYALMAASYALLMPSRWETFGMVAVEGLAAGAPVVAFEVGPLRDVAGGGGATLVPAFEVQAYANAIVQDVRHPRDIAAREAGRAWARRYDWDRLAEMQDACYRRALTHPAALHAPATTK